MRAVLPARHRRRLLSGRARHQIGVEPFAIITGYEYLLVNDAAKRVRPWPKVEQFDALVLDEAHKLKNPQAKTTMMVYGAQCAGGPDSLVGMAERTLLLTATPQLNHPGEWYPHMRALAPERLSMRSYDAFTQRYCTFKTRTITMKRRPGQARGRPSRSRRSMARTGRRCPTSPGACAASGCAARSATCAASSRPSRSSTRSIEPELCDAQILGGGRGQRRGQS